MKTTTKRGPAAGWTGHGICGVRMDVSETSRGAALRTAGAAADALDRAHISYAIRVDDYRGLYAVIVELCADRDLARAQAVLATVR